VQQEQVFALRIDMSAGLTSPVAALHDAMQCHLLVNMQVGRCQNTAGIPLLTLMLTEYCTRLGVWTVCARHPQNKPTPPLANPLLQPDSLPPLLV
jgi:hypothetical protein